MLSVTRNDDGIGKSHANTLNHFDNAKSFDFGLLSLMQSFLIFTLFCFCLIWWIYQLFSTQWYLQPLFIYLLFSLSILLYHAILPGHLHHNHPFHLFTMLHDYCWHAYTTFVKALRFKASKRIQSTWIGDITNSHLQNDLLFRDPHTPVAIRFRWANLACQLWSHSQRYCWKSWITRSNGLFVSIQVRNNDGHSFGLL